MKKLFAMLLAMAMLLCGLTAIAEEETFDMPHDTAILFLDGVQYDFVLGSVSNPGNGYINVLYSSDNGEAMGIALSDTAFESYFAAEPGADDMASIAILMSDGTMLISSCADYGYEDGYPCEMAITAYDRDGWYQVLAMGTAMCEETGDTYEMTVAFDFMWDGEGAAPAVEEAAADETPADDSAANDAAVEDTAVEEGEYFTPDVIEVVVGDQLYVMDLDVVDTDDGVYVQYSDEEGNLFSIGIYEELDPGEYYCADVDDEYAYFMLVTDTASYLGGCSSYIDDQYTYGSVDMIVASDGSDGLYQIGFMGELIEMTTGETLETAGFADFSVK